MDGAQAGPRSRHRRRVLRLLAAAGATPVLARAVAVLAQQGGRVTPEMIREAEWISGVELDDAKRELMLEGMGELLSSFERLRAVELDNAVPPALLFQVAAGARERAPEANGPERRPPRPTADDGDDWAFASLAALGARLRDGSLGAAELTRRYLRRLRRHDPALHCVITLTEELALEQAARADRELAAGRDRGPLHGIPWGAKDLLAVPGYPTTWGAKPYERQVRPETATVVRRLERAGAVLVAKTAVGALAWGDVWFGAKTRNPWKLEQGSSGSSAGSAAATAAGLVGFALGTETWGSIVSPCTRCGVTGLRPTFGRVSRHGAMALCWSMDKVGPIARSAEDCALVLAAIHGADGLDPTAVDRPFRWPYRGDPRGLRLGYAASQFEADPAAQAEDEQVAARLREARALDRAALDDLRRIGFELVPVELPATYPVSDLSFILSAEAATAFDELTRSGRDGLLVRQEKQAWPNVFRLGQLVPAVEYLRANRIRTLVQRELERLFESVDVYVSPTFGGDNLLRTNLTGHPQVVVPNGFRASDGTPASITFTGGLYGEDRLLAVAAAFQEATGHHLRRPPLEEST